MYHGQNNTHDTRGCFALKKFIKKGKEDTNSKDKSTSKYKSNKQEFNIRFIDALKAMKKANKAKGTHDREQVQEELNPFEGISLSHNSNNNDL